MASGYNVKLNLNISVVGASNAQREIASLTNQLGNMESRAGALLRNPNLNPTSATAINNALSSVGVAKVAYANADRGIRSEVEQARRLLASDDVASITRRVRGSDRQISPLSVAGALPTISSMRGLQGFARAVQEVRESMKAEGTSMTKREAESYVTRAIITQDSTALRPGTYNKLVTGATAAQDMIRAVMTDEQKTSYDQHLDKVRGQYGVKNQAVQDLGRAGNQLNKTVNDVQKGFTDVAKRAANLGQEINDELISMVTRIKEVDAELKKAEAALRREQKKYGFTSASTMDNYRSLINERSVMSDTARGLAIDNGMGGDPYIASVINPIRTGDVLGRHTQNLDSMQGASDRYRNQSFKINTSSAVAAFGENAGRFLARSSRNRNRIDAWNAEYIAAEQRGDWEAMARWNQKIQRASGAVIETARRAREFDYSGDDKFDSIARQAIADNLGESRMSGFESAALINASRRTGNIGRTREAQLRQTHAMDVISSPESINAVSNAYGFLTSDLNRMSPSELSKYESKMLQLRQHAHHLASNRNLPGTEVATRRFLDTVRASVGQNVDFNVESIDDFLGLTDTGLSRIRSARGSVYRPDSPMNAVLYAMTGGEGGGRGAYGRRNNTLFNKFNQNVTSFSGMAGLSLYGLGSIGLATALSRVTIQGAGEAEGMKNILAGLLNSSYNYVDTSGTSLSPARAFEQSAFRAENLYGRVRESAVKSVLTTQEMFDYVLSGSPMLMKKGLSFDESMPIIDSIASVGKSMGYQAPAIMSDIRDLAMGTVTTRSQVLRTLGIESEGLRAAMSGGSQGLKEYFQSKIAPFQGALDRVQDTPLGRISRFQDLTQQIGIQAGQGMLSGGFLDSLERIYERLKQLEADGTFEKAGNAMGKFIEALTNTALSITNNPIFQNMASNPVTAMGAAFGTYIAGSVYANSVRSRISNPFDAEEAARTPGRFPRNPGFGEHMFFGTLLSDTWGGALPDSNGYRRPTLTQRAKGWVAKTLAQPIRGQDGEDYPITRGEAIGNGVRRSAGVLAAIWGGLELFGDTIAGTRGPEAYQSLVEGNNRNIDRGFGAFMTAMRNPSAVKEYTSLNRRLMATEAGTLLAEEFLGPELRLGNRGEQVTMEPLLAAAMASMLQQGDVVGNLTSSPRVEGASATQLARVKQMLSDNSDLQKYFAEEIRNRNLFKGVNTRGEIVASATDISAFVSGRYGYAGTGLANNVTPWSRSSSGIDGVRSRFSQEIAMLERLNGGPLLNADQATEQRRDFLKAQQNGTVQQFLTNYYLSRNPQVKSDMDQGRMLFGQAATAQLGAYGVIDAQLSRQMGFVPTRSQGSLLSQQRAIGLAGIQNQFLVGMSQEGANPTELVQKFLAQQEQLEATYEQSMRAIVSERIAREENVRAIKEQTQMTKLQVESERATFLASIMPGDTPEQIRARSIAQAEAIDLSLNNNIAALGIQTAAESRALSNTDRIAGMSKSDLERATGAGAVNLPDMEVGGLKVEFGQMNTAFGIEFAKASLQIKDASLSFKDAFDQQRKADEDLKARTLEYIQATYNLGNQVKTLTDAVQALNGTLGGQTSAGTPQTVQQWQRASGQVPSSNGNTGAGIVGLPSVIQGMAGNTATGSNSVTPGSYVDTVAGRIWVAGAPPQGSANAPKASDDGWMRPVHGGRVTSGFGPRTRPRQGASRDHKGLDYGVPIGTSVHASRSGKVTFVGEKSGFGNTVVVDHGDGYTTLYAHLDSFDVKVGQQVGQGQVIARSGNTGISTGPHLHVEVRKNGVQRDPSGYFNRNAPKTEIRAADRNVNNSGVSGSGSTTADYEALRKQQEQLLRIQASQAFYSTETANASALEQTRLRDFSRADAFNQIQTGLLSGPTDPYGAQLSRRMAGLQTNRLQSQYAYEDQVRGIQSKFEELKNSLTAKLSSGQISAQEASKQLRALGALQDAEIRQLQNTQLEIDREFASGTASAQSRYQLQTSMFNAARSDTATRYGITRGAVGLYGRDLERYNATANLREKLGIQERLEGEFGAIPSIMSQFVAGSLRKSNLQIAGNIANIEAGFDLRTVQDDLTRSLTMEGLDRRQDTTQRRIDSAQRRFQAGVTGVYEGRGAELQRLFGEELDAGLRNVPTMAQLQSKYITEETAKQRALGITDIDAGAIMNGLKESQGDFEQQIKRGMIAALEDQERKMNNPARIRQIRAAMMQDRIIGSASEFGTGMMMNPMALVMGGQRTEMLTGLVSPYAQEAFGNQVSRSAQLYALSQGRRLSSDQLRNLGLTRDQKGRYRNEQGDLVNLDRMFRTQSGETLTQFGGNFLGNFLGQQVMGGDPASTNLGTQIGALAGPSVFGSTLGSFGGPVGAVVGGMLGGLFGRRRNPEDEELRRWRDGVLRGISNMDKSLRFQNDMWRAVRGEQLTGVASRFLGNRYNSSASREASLGVA